MVCAGFARSLSVLLAKTRFLQAASGAFHGPAGTFGGEVYHDRIHNALRIVQDLLVVEPKDPQPLLA